MNLRTHLRPRLRHLLGAALLASCATANVTSMRQVARETTFDAAVAEAVQVAESPVILTVASIADSRCPSDVTCVTAGDAVVVLRLSGDGDRTDTLHTSRMGRHATTYAGHQVELVDVKPYPVSTARDVVRTAVLRVLPPR